MSIRPIGRRRMFAAVGQVWGRAALRLGAPDCGPRRCPAGAIDRSSVGLVDQTMSGVSPQPQVSDVLLHLWKGEAGQGRLIGRRRGWQSKWPTRHGAGKSRSCSSFWPCLRSCLY